MGFFSHVCDAKSGSAAVSTLACRILTENNKTTSMKKPSHNLWKKKKAA